MRKRSIGLAVAAALMLLVQPAQAKEVSTSAKACVVMDMATGRVLLSHNADTPLPMASTTKIMTALVALENAALDDTVTTGRNAFGVPGTSIYLSLGEQLSMEHMLYGLMLASGNDAAVAIAEHVGGSVEDFCAMMNARAAELGCVQTVFLTPHGLPKDGHRTTAYELALITRTALQNDAFRTIVSTQRAKIPWPGREYDRVLNNKNRLLAEYEGTIGVKTGYTRAAGRCLVTAAVRDGMGVICVVLNCADWFDESERLLDLAFAGWDSITLLHAGEQIRAIPVENSGGSTVRATLACDLTGLVPEGSLPALEIDLPESLCAPVQAGQALGEARLMAGGEVVGTAMLVADGGVARDTFASRLARIWLLWR